MTKNNLMNWCYKYSVDYHLSGNEAEATRFEMLGDLVLFCIPDDKLKTLGDEPTGPHLTPEEVIRYTKIIHGLED